MPTGSNQSRVVAFLDVLGVPAALSKPDQLRLGVAVADHARACASGGPAFSVQMATLGEVEFVLVWRFTAMVMPTERLANLTENIVRPGLIEVVEGIFLPQAAQLELQILL